MATATTLFQRILFVGLLLIASAAQAQTPALEVEDSGGTTLFQVNTDGTLRLPVGAASGFVLTTDASGNTSWQAGPGLALPFSGSYDLLPPAFSLSKTGPGELLALSKTGPGQALFITSGGGSVGDFAARINGSFGGITTQAGNGFGVDVTNNSASATIRAINNGAGLAAEFQGSVDVTGDLDLSGDFDCTACIRGAEVNSETLTGDHIDDETLTTTDIMDGTLTSEDIENSTIRSIDIQNGTLTAADVSSSSSSGIYVSKEQISAGFNTFTVPAGGTASGQAACGDNDHLPLQGTCSIPSGDPAFLVSQRALGWSQTDVPAIYECTYFNNTASAVTAQATVLCISN